MIMRILSGLLGVVLFTFSAFPVTATIVTNDNGYYIGIYDDTNSYTWDEANTYAQVNYGTRLASILSATDMTNALNALVLDGPAWIGAHDTNNQGIYEWLDGAPFAYENFFVGEPNSGVSSAVYMEGSSFFGQWFDTSPTNTFSQFVINVTDFEPLDPPDPPAMVSAPAVSVILGLGISVLGWRRARERSGRGSRV